MLYYVEFNLRFEKEFNVVCGIRKLDELISSVIEHCDCELSINTRNGKIHKGSLETFAGGGIFIKFIALDDYYKAKKETIDYIDKVNKIQKK